MTSSARLRLAVAALLATATAASAQTITVNISSDTIDIPSSGTIDDLPGPDGDISFSEAMIASNNTPGRQTIGFAIPEDDWSLQFLYPGRAVLQSITGYYFREFDEVTIDGTTQTEYTGDTNPDGWEVVIHAETLYLIADHCTLIGFDSTDVSVSGSESLVEGNSGWMNITLYSGSGTMVKGNTGGTIKIDRSSENVVVGNTVQRVRVQGGGPTASNNRVGGPDPEDRNFIIGYGTWNSEGLPAGTTIQLFDTAGTVIENNRIGTTPDGMAQGNVASTIGIGFEGENHDTIIRDNLIAGILGEGRPPHHSGRVYGWAMLIGGAGSGVTITRNTVGLNADGDPVLGSVFGIDVGNSRAGDMSGIRIGGTDPDDGNTIAGHRFNGVTVGRNVNDVRLSGNSIYDNAALGIDLIPSGYGYGVSANDPLDADTGGNGLQNFPEIDSATREGAAIRFIGALRSSPSNDFTVEFFASPECDATGFGEGRAFLGSTSISTDDAGDAGFDVGLTAMVAEDWIVSATATLEPLGATSEFSACVLVTGDAVPGDANGDGVVDFADLLLVLSSWGPCEGDCPADLDGNGVVDFADLLIVLANWT